MKGKTIKSPQKTLSYCECIVSVQLSSSEQMVSHAKINIPTAFLIYCLPWAMNCLSLSMSVGVDVFYWLSQVIMFFILLTTLQQINNLSLFWLVKISVLFVASEITLLRPTKSKYKTINWLSTKIASSSERCLSDLKHFHNCPQIDCS